MTSDNEIGRRKLLGTVGAVGGLAIAGGGFAALSGGATATAGSSIDNPDAVTTDDGEIRYVRTHTTGRLNWDGFDEPAKYGRIFVGVELHRNGGEIASKWIHDTRKFELGGDWGGSGEEINLDGDHEAGQSGYIASDASWDIIQASGYDDGSNLPSDPMAADELFADNDGSQQKTRVVLKSQYRLYDASGSELTGTQGYPARPKASSGFVVTVNNQESSTSFGGQDGDGDTDDSAEVGA
jgi:hypothetical protein